MMTATTSPSPIVPSVPTMPLGRTLRAYAVAAKYETLAALRNVGMAVPFLVLPPAIYWLFGVVIIPPEAGDSEYGPGIVNYLFSSFSAFGAMMPGLFGGATIAVERENGLLKLKRALPAPPGAQLVAKTFMAILVTAGAVTAVVAVALLAGTITLSGMQVLTIWAAMIAGSIPFCAIGLFIGSLASSAAVPAYGNLVFLPMIYLSGLFIPLPDFLDRWVVIWPAFHLNQVALGLAGVDEFGFFPPQSSALVLLSVTVLFGGLAIRRLARTG